jgi:pilus assembly protein CpaC
MTSRRITYAAALAMIVIMVLPPFARAQTAARAENAVGAVAGTGSAPVLLNLMVGRSTVIRMDRPITRVSLSTPDIADAMATSPYEVLVHGKMPGTISLLIWGDNGRITTYDVSVRRDLSELSAQVKSQFPEEKISVSGNGKDVVLAGSVSSKYIMDRAVQLAAGYVDKPENVVSLMQQQASPVSNQVLLRVRFAEVSRSAVQELGASFFTGIDGHNNWVGRTTTQQFPAPDFEKDKGLVFSDFLNLFAFNTEENIGMLVKALKTKGLFQSLAEPNLVTQDGKEASFLAGGEYPYPVIQAGAGNNAVTIVFKEFGVRLRFTPTITADDSIHLKVAPEVSTLDFGNGLVLSGFRVPSLATRRTETEVELRDGQTFAIAGLLDNKVDETLRKVPGIGDIPVLGYLFKSQAYTKNATELVVMITPHILRRDSPGVTPNLPGLEQPFLSSPGKRIAPPAPAFTSPQTENTPAAAAPTASAAQAPASAAQNTAAASAPASSNVGRVLSDPAVPGKDADHPATASKKEQAALAKEAAARQEAERKQAKEQQAAAVKQAAADAERARKEAAVAAAAAKVEAQRKKKEEEEQSRAQRLEAARQQTELRAAEKRAVEQAAIDRKRMEDQQEAAARVKEIADRLAKEQEKQRLIDEKAQKEKADRDAELTRLVEQYRKLTATDAAQPK